jgi:hypothetical protein
VKYTNIYGGGHSIICYNDCDVENSWLHENADGASAGAHQNSFLSVTGSDISLTHNSMACTGGCTADIALLNQGGQERCTVSNNLLVYAPMAAFWG